MPEPILCPSCQKPLRVSADVHLAWLTCPRCLALVPNPAAESNEPLTAPPPVAPAAPAVPAVPATSAREVVGESGRPSIALPSGGTPGVECPGCGKPADARWVFCPYCERPLRSPRGGAIDRFVRRDSQQTSGFIIMLAVLGGGAMLVTLLGAGSALAGGDVTALVPVMLGLMLVLCIGTVVTLTRSKGNPRDRGVGRILFNALAVTGGLVAASAVIGFALVVFAFVVCLAGSGGRC